MGNKNSAMGGEDENVGGGESSHSNGISDGGKDICVASVTDVVESDVSVYLC